MRNQSVTCVPEILGFRSVGRAVNVMMAAAVSAADGSLSVCLSVFTADSQPPSSSSSNLPSVVTHESTTTIVDR